MDIEKAISFLKNSVTRDSGFSPVFIANIDVVIGHVEEQLTDKWIPVSERSPEEYGTYLVAWRPTCESANDVKINTGGKVTHYYEILEFDPDDESGWLDSIEQSKDYVILAWRPLPEPYKGE